MKTKLEKRQRRKYHVRNRLMRDGAQVRLTVTRSSKHIQAQVVDAGGRTLCGVSSTKTELAGEFTGKKKAERAAVIGREIARLARRKGVATVGTDRGSHERPGQVKAVGEAGRAGGLHSQRAGDEDQSRLSRHDRGVPARGPERGADPGEPLGRGRQGRPALLLRRAH